MKSQFPNLYDLMVVESLAYHKSLSIAALELKLSTSALSRQLSSIETNLETRIFDRDTRNLSLTSTGVELVQVAKKVLYEADENLGCFQPHLKSRLKRLTISTLSSVTGVLLPRLLTGFITNHPRVNLEINDENPSELVETIESGQVDVGLTLGTISIRRKLSFVPLFEENFVVLSNKKDSSMKRNEYSLEEILELPVISGKKGTSYRDYIDSVCDREGLYFAPQIEATQIVSAVSMVNEGLGITILPTLLLPLICTEKLKIHRVTRFQVPSSIGIAYSSEIISPAAKNLVAHTIEVIQPLYQSIKEEYSI